MTDDMYAGIPVRRGLWQCGNWQRMAEDLMAFQDAVQEALGTEEAGHVLDAIDRLKERAARNQVGAEFAVGYVTGLYAAAQWVAQFEQRRGYGPAIHRQLRAGLDAIVLHAIGRLGRNPDGVTVVDWQAGDVVALEQLRRNEQIRIDGGLA